MWIKTILNNAETLQPTEINIKHIKGKIVDQHPLEDPKYKNNMDASFKMQLNGEVYLHKTKIVENTVLIPKQFDIKHVSKVEDPVLIDQIDHKSDSKLKKVKINEHPT